MNERQIFKSEGFTVVEIIVVLAIIGVITSIIIFNIGSERKNSALLRSAQNLSLNLRQVENYALSSKVFKTEGVPCGWGIHFSGTGSTSYIIFADLVVSAASCSNQDFVRNPDGSEDFEAVNLESGITISGLSNGLSDVIFIPPDPIVKFRFTPDDQSQTSASITLTNKDGAPRVININKTGFISSP